MLNENGDKIDEKRDILAEISKVVAKRIQGKKKDTSFEEMKSKAISMEKGDFAFENAIKNSKMAFICEVKKASPSKGIIAEDFPYLEIAKDYEKAGATCISCLTEEKYFQGSDQFLTEIANEVSIPVLRKDFFVDPYMVYEAKVLGASAVLLICSILNDKKLAEYFAIANELGLSAIFEAHDLEEVKRAEKCGARIIGVNNRNLKTFQLDLQNSINLKKSVSSDIIFISESGIKTKEDIKRLKDNGINAVLIGETLMKATNKEEILRELKELL